MTRVRIGIVIACVLLTGISCGRKPDAGAGAAPTAAAAAVATPAATVDVVKPTPGSLRRGPACDLISRAEMATLLDGPIGKPSGENSDAKTSCIWPPADASSRAQAEVTIEWDHGTESSFESQLAGAFGGSAVGHKVAHTVPFGDEAAYSLEGVLTVRTGRTLVTISLPMRPGAEEHSMAVARKLFERMGADPTPKAAATAREEEKEKDQPESLLGQIFGAINELVADEELLPKAKEDERTDALPEGFVPDGECPEVPADSGSGVTDQPARIPLIEGLTLSQIWVPTGSDYEHECLDQITKIDAREISITTSCPNGPKRILDVNQRRMCRADFANARLYEPAISKRTPVVMGGTTFFNLSQASFRELKDAGETKHRYIFYEPVKMQRDFAGIVKREKDSTFKIIVNNREVDLPVLNFSGPIGIHHLQLHGAVLDDSQFPLMLDYGWDDYSLRYTKISFPEPSTLEEKLEKERKVDVYGIYFDFASDVIRAESEPILKEIAGVLAKNAEWTLSITGHTDNIGGDKSNLDLSRRRSEAVRKALTERYAIAPARLTTSGYGASQPKATNDTIEGRAQNRRVELIRR